MLKGNLFVFGVCLLLCVCCLFGIYHLQAEPPPQEIPLTPPPALVAEPQSPVRFVSAPATDISSDFYQTIIKNNLFAPLSTDLHKKPVPGANIRLIATMTNDVPADATAIVQNIATGEQKTVGVADTIGSYQVQDIQAKQILIQRAGERAVWKRMTPFLLNS